MFEQSFPKLRVDSGGKPTIIYALRNEDSLKLLMPNYGQNKNAMKLAGQYRPSSDKNFAIVRTDVTGTGSNPYHVMYHEYAHGLFRLNYRGLPLWLDEGLAEYWGGSDIQNKEAQAGTADVRQIRVLQQNQLLPIATLVSIDATSPSFNSQDHSGIFYAESWALVHYLSMAPEVRDQNLLNKYLATLQQTDDPIEAANKTFGDLKKFGEKLETYVRLQAFYYNRIKLNSSISEKDFSARQIKPAEALVHQADFLLHAGHLPEAIGVLHEAEQLDPSAAGLHDGFGYYHFLKADYDNAEKEFALALEANPNDAGVYFYRASIRYRKNGYGAESTPQIISNLEKSLGLQPDFAPGYAFLSMAYAASASADQKSKAIATAVRAVNLEPGNMAYFIDYGRALLANGKQSDAKQIADRAERTATWQRDRSMASAFMKSLNSASNTRSSDTNTSASDPASGESFSAAAEKISTSEGKITELICGHPPSVMFTLTTPTEQLLFQAKDINKLNLLDESGGSSANLATCSTWRDRTAKVSYLLTSGSPAHGEVKAIAFE
jgi:tetratricopeptide (TPR) repeat protein